MSRKDLLVQKLAELWHNGSLKNSETPTKDLKIQILDFLQNDEEIFKKILRYEVLDIK